VLSLDRPRVHTEARSRDPMTYPTNARSFGSIPGEGVRETKAAADPKGGYSLSLVIAESLGSIVEGVR
jgi:hypothetical protein